MKYFVAAIFVLALSTASHATQAPVWLAGANKGEICLETANLGIRSYAKAVCGKDLGNPKQYACVFTDGTSSTCWKDGDCFVCTGED
jgi:hypothetical protein